LSEAKDLRAHPTLSSWSEAKDLLLFLSLSLLLYLESAMRQEHMYFVYILANRSKSLYIGVTNSLIRRIQEHKDKKHDCYTAKYNIDRLVYFEQFAYINNAIAREKQLKTWLRHRKIELIQTSNPTWEDLFLQYNQPIPPPLD
jgi:putative endonuclease